MKTFNQFINESVRDKMTPKSKEDILQSLPGRKDIIFKPTTEKNGMSESLGFINFSYSDLVKIFGEPIDYDYYNTSTLWTLKDNLGRIVMLKDYKSTKLGYPSVEEFKQLPSYNWRILGKHDEKDVVEDLKVFIVLNM